MPNVQQILNDEIRRLARKEVKIACTPMQKALVEARRQIGDLKKQLKFLEGKLNVTIPEKTEKTAPADEKKIRMTPAMITKLREKLGLNRKQFAQLIGANILSVCNWENGKTVPRLAQKQKIAAVRHLGKRELQALLQEKNIVIKVRKTKAAKKNAPAAAKAAAEKAPAEKVAETK